MGYTGMEDRLEWPRPSIRPVPNRLLDVLKPLPDGLRWPLGVRTVPYGWQGLNAVDADCDPSDMDDGGSFPSTYTQAAFKLYDALECSLLSVPDVDIDSRLEWTVEAHLSAALASELVTGAGSGGMALSTHANLVTYGGPLIDAFLALDADLALRLGGAGLIHVPRGVLGKLMAGDVVIFDGLAAYAPSGHRIVADPGHTNTPSTGYPDDGSTTYLYGTGDIFFGSTDPDLLGALNHETVQMDRNIRRRFIEQYGLLIFDPEVSLWAASTEAAVYARQAGEVGGLDPYTFDAARYSGFSLYNPSGSTAALVYIRDGGPAGDIIDIVALAAGESAAREFVEPLWLNNGQVTIEAAAGTVNGVLRFDA